MQVNEFKPLIVAFCCNWCSYAGADLAGTTDSTIRQKLRSYVFHAHAE